MGLDGQNVFDPEPVEGGRFSNFNCIMLRMSEEGSKVELPKPDKVDLADRQELPKKSLVDRAGEFVLSRKELLPFALISGADLTREILTKDPVLTPEHLLTGPGLPENVSTVLSHGGGVFDAYATSMLAYYGISLLTYPAGDKVPTSAKVAVASLIGLGVVAANEMGVMRGGFQELPDIPSGVLGAMIFAGVMHLNKEFIKDCGGAIKKLRSRIKKEGSSERQEVVKPNLAKMSSQAPDK